MSMNVDVGRFNSRELKVLFNGFGFSLYVWACDHLLKVTWAKSLRKIVKIKNKESGVSLPKT